MTDIKFFADNLDEATLSQIEALRSAPAFEGAVIRVMPDAHAGKGSVIGFTARVTNGRVVPNVVGVDIGCGMLCKPLGELKDYDPIKLDRIVRKKIPHGMAVSKKEYPGMDREWLSENLRCFGRLPNKNRLVYSMGSLGGGNHFIETDVDAEGNYYLIIHTGSRNLGAKVAEYYQALAETRRMEVYADELCAIRKKTARETKEKQAEAFRAFEESVGITQQDKDLFYLEGQDADDYLHDMDVCVEFAKRNRERILEEILTRAEWTDCGEEPFHTVHNYAQILDGSRDYIVRKGAIAAEKDDIVLIPFNMRDGCVIARGRGNSDWNGSAPHGAGRAMSRSQCFRTLDMEEYRQQMRGVYSTSVVPETIDESPMAYKDRNAILRVLPETVEIVKVLRPVQNFKSAEEMDWKWRKRKPEQRKRVSFLPREEPEPTRENPNTPQ